MKVIMRLKEATSWNGESIVLCGGEGHETPVARFFLSSIGYNKIEESRVSEIVHALLTSCDEMEFDIPGELEDYTGAKTPGWIAAAASGTRVRVSGGASGSGEIVIPVGAKFLPSGEIEVPPRSDDGKHPDAKKFRRACRKARNAVRALSEASGRTVGDVMLDIQEKKQ